MRTLHIVAGHGGNDPGAIGNGHKEAELTHELAALIADQLTDHKVELHANQKHDFQTKLKAVNSSVSEVDVVLDIHFNAFTTQQAKGTEAYVKRGAAKETYILGQNLVAAVRKSLGTADRGVKPESNSQHARLAILHTKAAHEVLLEVCFLTNDNDIQAYLSNKEQVAKDIASCIKQSGLVSSKAKKMKKKESEESED